MAAGRWGIAGLRGALRRLERSLRPFQVATPFMHVEAANANLFTTAPSALPARLRFVAGASNGNQVQCSALAAQIPSWCGERWRNIGGLAKLHGFRGSQVLRFERHLRTEVAREVSVKYLDGDLKGAVVVSLERPIAKNALGRALLDQLKDAIEAIIANKDEKNNNVVRAVVLRSTVPKVFCAGADLKERMEMTVDEVRSFVRELGATFRSLEELMMPTIAVLEGHALGGGLELALSCDLRVAGQNARLGLPETGLAIIPGAGGTQRLPRLVGVSKAKELIFTGRIVDAQEAWRIGLINHLVGPGEAYDKALELVAEILKKGPVAIEAAKLAINKGIESPLEHGLEVEQDMYEETLTTSDRLEGLAAFVEKRAPVYTGE